MFILSNVLAAVAKILDIGLSLYMWIIIGRAVISWVNPDPFNPIVRFLRLIIWFLVCGFQFGSAIPICQ